MSSSTDSAAALLAGALRASLLTPRSDDFLLENDTPIAFFFDGDRFQSLKDDLFSAFPNPQTLHALAVKANPAVLEFSRALGFGAECASEGELRLAISLGFPGDKLVFDSPVKTARELALALRHGVLINADSLAEVDRLRELIPRVKQQFPDMPVPRVGVRVNVQGGAGAIAETSTATLTSKFGVPLKFGSSGEMSTRSALLAAYRQNPWMCAVHVHVGSQGCSLDMMVAAARQVLDLVNEINAGCPEGNPQVTTFDLGGGLPVNYATDLTQPTFTEYAARLRAACPVLFAAPFRLVTEFGRAMTVKCGVALARVEYTKRSVVGYTPAGAVAAPPISPEVPRHSIALTHAGADCFLRECYRPEQWPHRIGLLDGVTGSWKGWGEPQAAGTNPSGGETWDIAGPLCFSGDVIGRRLLFPPNVDLTLGDWVMISDAGGYTLGMFSAYNSRSRPPQYWVDRDPTTRAPSFRLMRNFTVSTDSDV
ncbi:putative diaminopimelate decarboxylase [Paratrimastix pyriformis]|uniref:Diaminopimelate decarboxylase n=1 Tax=Paratrimastix pyriformis TaxID=342808 RepID=A0ABQ8UVS9_9EUKA|nr:putative diaminopimelate decarboxylase [Paratrimastix pyriformis]